MVFSFIFFLFILWLLIGLQVYKLPTDRIYATYFGGDEKSGLSPDTEARDMWLKFLPPGHVLPFGCKVCFPSISISYVCWILASHNFKWIVLWVCHKVFVTSAFTTEGDYCFIWMFMVWPLKDKKKLIRVIWVLNMPRSFFPFTFSKIRNDIVDVW